MAHNGETITFTLVVINNGNVVDTFDLTTSDNSWPTSLVPPNITLPASVTANVGVTVTVPITAMGNHSDTVSVTAVSIADPAESSITYLTTVISPSYGVSISADKALAGTAGQTLTYTLKITNTGNISDTFSLTKSGNSWPTNISDPSILLAPLASTVVSVSVDIPGTAVGGDNDTVTVTVTSLADSTVSRNAFFASSVPFVPTYGVQLSADDAASGKAGTPSHTH
jgi:uncharacterized repeat protein (TIGR01451 family)